MLTTRGWPWRRATLARPGRPGAAGGEIEFRHRLADQRRLDGALGRRVKAAGDEAEEDQEDGQRHPETAGAHAVASSSLWRCAARARTRPISESKPPSATMHAAQPDQGDEGLPPEPQLPAPLRILLAERDVELAVPAGRRSPLRWSASAAVLNIRACGAMAKGVAVAAPRRQPRLDRGPVRPGDRLDAVEAHRERPDTGASGPGWPRPKSPADEGAFRGHAGQCDGDAEMGGDHAPGEERRAAQVAAPERRDAGRRDARRKHQAEQGQQADAAARRGRARTRRSRRSGSGSPPPGQRFRAVAAPAQQRARSP